MQTHTTPSIWKREISMPMAVMAVALSVVASLAVFEQQTGLPASIRTNPVYGSLPVHSASTTSAAPVIRRTASTSSVKSLTKNAQRRLRMRARQHQAASRSSAAR